VVVGCANLGAWADSKDGTLAARSRELLNRACTARSWAACAELAALEKRGGNVARAEQLAKQACDQKQALACHVLGTLLLDRARSVLGKTREAGDDLPEIEDAERLAREALRLERDACGQQQLEACYVAAVTDHPDGLSDDNERLRSLSRACPALPVACYELARRLEKLKRFDEAVGYDERACDAGSWQSCGALADMVLGDRGVPLDPRRGRELLLKACSGVATEHDEDEPLDQRTRPRALPGSYCFDAGVRLLDDNPVRAAEVLGLGCNKRVPRACAKLGRLYELGQGVAQNEDRAHAFYKQACGDEPWRRLPDGSIHCSKLLRPPELRWGATTVSARLPPKVIKWAFMAQSYPLWQCYRRAGISGKNRQLRPSAGFTINATGRVSDVKILGPGLGEDWTACVAQALGAMQFPQLETGWVRVQWELEPPPPAR
jgi:TPR repeat protein